MEERKGSQAEETQKAPDNVGDVLCKRSCEAGEGGSVQGSRGAGAAACCTARLGELCSPGVSRTKRVMESVLEAD